MTKTRTVLAGVLLGGLGLAAVMASGPRAAAQGQAACGNHWLRGDYAFTLDGTILAGPSPMLVRGVSMTRFDGAGNMSQVDFVTANGTPLTPDWRQATGRYQINADCTGSGQIVPVDGSPTLNLRMVVFDRGSQVRTVVIGNAVGSHGVRVQ